MELISLKIEQMVLIAFIVKVEADMYMLVVILVSLNLVFQLVM